MVSLAGASSPVAAAALVLRRLILRRQVWFILAESAAARWLAPAICEDHRKVRNDQGADRGDRGEPAQVIDEEQQGDHEADSPDGHHDQVAPLAERDVRSPARACLRDQVGLVARGALIASHISTLCPPGGDRHATSMIMEYRAVLPRGRPLSHAIAGRFP